MAAAAIAAAIWLRPRPKSDYTFESLFAVPAGFVDDEVDGGAR